MLERLGVLSLSFFVLVTDDGTCWKEHLLPKRQKPCGCQLFPVRTASCEHTFWKNLHRCGDLFVFAGLLPTLTPLPTPNPSEAASLSITELLKLNGVLVDQESL
jgi:hypothetical protein